MEGVFGSTNVIAIMVPVGDYEREGMLARDLESMAEVESVTALSNVEAMDGYVLTDRLTPRQFAELTDLDIEVARLLYSAYAVDQGSYGQIVGGLDRYGVPLIDMFLFVYDRMENGYVTLDDDMTASIEDLHQQLSDAQLKGENFSRLVVQLALPEETPETFAFLDVLHAAAKYYPEDVYVVGNTTSDFDLSSSFSNDNLRISILTIVFVILLLGDVIIEKTAITLKHTGVLHAHAGAMRVHGHVRGYVSGMVDADFTSSLVGMLNVNLEGGSIQQLDAPPPELESPPPGSAPETEQEVAQYV